MPNGLVGFTFATGKVARRAELLIRIHSRVDTLGVLAVASQHRVRLFLRVLRRAFFTAANGQGAQPPSGLLDVR